MRTFNLDTSFFRFILVGLVNTAVGLGLTFALLNLTEAGYWLSTWIGNAAGACVSFVLNRSFTFRSDVSWRKGFLLFTLVVMGCYVISYGLGITFIEWALPLIVPHASARIIENVAVIAGMALYTVTNYFAQKKIVFTSSRLRNTDNKGINRPRAE